MMIGLRSVLEPLSLRSVRALQGVTTITDASVRRQASRVLIKRHHERLGGSRGPMGIPMGDVRPTPTGLTMPFSGGNIELKHNESGPNAIKRHRAEVRFLGFHCHEESNEWSSADEPYFTVSVFGVNHEGRVTKIFGPYEDVDKGENRTGADVLTTLAQPPFSISVVGMEHDEGNPAEAAARVEKTLNDVANRVSLALHVFYPSAKEVGSLLQSVVNVFGDTLGGLTREIFGLADDFIGQNHRVINDWNAGEEKWRPPPRIGSFEGNPYNVSLDVEGGGGEGKFTVYFNVHLFEVHEVPVPP